MRFKPTRCTDPICKHCVSCEYAHIECDEFGDVVDVFCIYGLESTTPTPEELAEFDEWVAKIYPQETEAK